MKIKPTNTEKPIEVLPQPEAPVEQPKEQPRESNITTYEFDEVKSEVGFSLTDGTAIVLREPTPYDFLQLDAWLSRATEDQMNPLLLFLKLAHLCVIEYSAGELPNFERFGRSLPKLEDVERVIAALNFFPDPMSDYTDRLKKAADIVGAKYGVQGKGAK